MEDIDREVAEKVMGWNPNEDGDWDTPDGHWCGYYEHEWHPSTSISDAWQVVEKVTSGGDAFEMGCPYQDKDDWWVKFSRNECAIEADTAPLAICKAALKAVG